MPHLAVLVLMFVLRDASHVPLQHRNSPLAKGIGTKSFPVIASCLNRGCHRNLRNNPVVKGMCRAVGLYAYAARNVWLAFCQQVWRAHASFARYAPSRYVQYMVRLGCMRVASHMREGMRVANT
jgi:hypothetical protein